VSKFPNPERILGQLHRRIHEQELAGFFSLSLIKALDAAVGANGCPPDEVDCCCNGAGHEEACCPGWLHMNDPHEIQRCDECRRFSNDDDARIAHDDECDCTDYLDY
jgi:hypothetical protein